MKILKECLRHAGKAFVTRYGIPHSRVIQFHTGTIAVPWPEWRVSHIDPWVLKCLPNGVRRTGVGLDALPRAKRSEVFPEVFISTGG